VPDKDVDEQFAAIMAHWDDVALGLDPFGDSLADDDKPGAARNGKDGTGGPDVGAATPSGVDDSGPRSSPVAEVTPPSDSSTTTTPPAARPAPASDTSPSADRKPPRPAAAPQPLPEDDTPPLIGAGWRQHDPPDVEEHFVPPPPAPLPSADDKHFWLMMVGLIGGPLLFLYLILFARDGNGWWMMFALGMAIAGFVLLVLRQPFERDEDDDGVRL